MNSMDVEDQEANYFACCLLMPIELLRKDVKNFDILDPKQTKKLATKYGVSPALLGLWIGILTREKLLEIANEKRISTNNKTGQETIGSL